MRTTDRQGEDDPLAALDKRDRARDDADAIWLRLSPLIDAYHEARDRERAFAARFYLLLEADSPE